MGRRKRINPGAEGILLSGSDAMVTAEPLVIETPELRLCATSDPGHALVEEFYAGFDRAFVLANEKESLEGIRQCLQLNASADGERLARRWGRVREYVSVADAKGRVIGGANFIVSATQPAGNGTAAPAILVHLNYVYVLPEARGAGHLRRIVEAVARAASTFAASRPSAPLSLLQRLFGRSRAPWPRPLIFIEQNDPYRLSAEDYAADTAQAGIDQFTRIAVWSALGARVVDFPYVQPALSQEQEPDPNLVLAVMGCDGASLPAALLKAHLERFFAISVLKGRELNTSPPACDQIAALQRMAKAGKSVALLAMPKDRLLAAGKARATGTAALHDNLRAFLAAAQQAR
jgi:GNAT superfamily N-acetyltransferase